MAALSAKQQVHDPEGFNKQVLKPLEALFKQATTWEQ